MDLGSKLWQAKKNSEGEPEKRIENKVLKRGEARVGIREKEQGGIPKDDKGDGEPDRPFSLRTTFKAEMMIAEVMMSHKNKPTTPSSTTIDP